MTTPTLTADTLHRKLVEKLEANPPWQDRVLAYIRAKSGHDSLEAFHSNGAPKEVKQRIYADSLTAILTDNPGRIAVPEVNRDTLAAASSSPTEPEKIPTPGAPALTEPTKALEAAEPGNLAALIAAAVAPHVRSSINEDQVRAIACEAVRDLVRQSVTTIEVKRWDGSTVDLTGQHRQFKQVLAMVSARKLHNGHSVPVYCYGAPGGGKSHMMASIAKALGFEDRFYPYSCGPTDTGSKLVGFVSMAAGQYVPGLLHRPFKEGGLAVISEIDLTDGSVLASINNLIENDRYTFPNGETVARHPDFHILCDANTIGKGASGGFTRNKLDAATRTRFAFVRIEYDPDLERRLVPGYEAWVDYVLKVRGYVEAHCRESAYISPRATINGAALLRNGLDPAAVCDSVLFTDFSEATRQTILANVGTYQP